MARVESKSARARKSTRVKVEPLAGTPGPNEEQIRVLAYRLYEMRATAGIEGSADGDWIEAERQLVGHGGLRHGPRPRGARAS